MDKELAIAIKKMVDTIQGFDINHIEFTIVTNKDEFGVGYEYSVKIEKDDINDELFWVTVYYDISESRFKILNQNSVSFIQAHI